MLILSQTIAKEYVVENTKITKMYQFTDGYIFVSFNKVSNCSCVASQRMAFHKKDNEKYYMSAALTALTAGKSVTILGEDVGTTGGCPVHGNTAAMTQLHIFAN